MSYDPNFLEYLGGLETKPAAVTKKQMKKTTDAVLKKTALKRKPSAAKQCGRILLIAAAVVAGAAVTAAASGVNLGGLFRGYFEGGVSSDPVRKQTASSLTESQVGVLDKSGAVLNQSVTDNGTTITVKAAVSDKSSAYILLDVVAPEGTKLSRDDYSFEHAYTVLDLSDVHSSYSQTQKLYTLKDENPNDNKKSFVLEMGCHGFDMRNRKLQLTLSNFSTVREGKAVESFDHVIEGTWKFNPFILESSIRSKELTVNRVIQFKPFVNPKASAEVRAKAAKETYQCTVKSISFSPFSAIVSFTGEAVTTKGDSFRVPDDLTVHLKDGTEIVVQYPSGGSATGKDSSNVWLFETPIDVNSVASLTLGDLTIPVS